MNIFVDESGSFVSAPNVNSWNCVVAYVAPEDDARRMRIFLAKLKRGSGHPVNEEIKLRDVSESEYFAFLQRLNTLSGVLFAVATDAGRNNLTNVIIHQKVQVLNILKNKPRMKYERGREAVQILSDQLEALSPQLYVQLHCQVILLFDVVSRSLLYFVQRHPKSLGKFRWRVDQKNTTKIDFEDAFEKVAPAFLQSISLERPIVMLKGADYSYLTPYQYKEGEAPTYLKDDYGIEVDSGINIQKIIRDDIKFVDSKANKGVQVADLLASGLRRCLRHGFTDNLEAARLLGQLMLQAQRHDPPLLLIGFSDSRLSKNGAAYKAVNVMRRNSRPMLELK